MRHDVRDRKVSGLDLVLLDAAVLDALLSGDRERAEGLVGFSFPVGFPDQGEVEMLRFRREQLEATPSWGPWLVRAIVDRDRGMLVGVATFHGPPGINDLAAPGAAEIGYVIRAENRNRGYATEATRALQAWAREQHGVTHFVAGVAPDNLPSLRVLNKLGYEHTGIIDDGELIFDLHLDFGTAPRAVAPTGNDVTR